VPLGALAVGLAEFRRAEVGQADLDPAVRAVARTDAQAIAVTDVPDHAAEAGAGLGQSALTGVGQSRLSGSEQSGDGGEKKGGAHPQPSSTRGLTPAQVSAWAGLAAEALRCARKPERSPKGLVRLSRAAGRALTPAEKVGESVFVGLVALSRRWGGLTLTARYAEGGRLEALARGVDIEVERRRQPAPRRWRADVDG
jgi:hypothetical protein